MIAFVDASATLHLSLLFSNNYFCQKRYYFITFEYKSKKITKYKEFNTENVNYLPINESSIKGKVFNNSALVSCKKQTRMLLSNLQTHLFL